MLKEAEKAGASLSAIGEKIGGSETDENEFKRSVFEASNQNSGGIKGLMGERTRYSDDPRLAENQLNASSALYRMNGYQRQGDRLAAMAVELHNFNSGNSLLYQGTKLSPEAISEYGDILTPETFIGYQYIKLFNAVMSTDPRDGRIVDEAVKDVFRILAHTAGNKGRQFGEYLKDLEFGNAVLENAVHFIGGVVTTTAGFTQLILTPVGDAGTILGTALAGLDEKSWETFKVSIERDYQRIVDCDSASKGSDDCAAILGEHAFDILGAAALVKGIVIGPILRKGATVAAEAELAKIADLARDARAMGINDATKFSEFVETAGELGPCAEGGCRAGAELANAERIIDSAKKWDSVESLIHVAKGNYQIAVDGSRQLVSGMHTRLGFDNFLKLNQNAGKTLSIRNVTEFTAERVEAGGAILSQTLDNGVRRIQLPRDAWANADAFSDAIAYTDAGQRIKGIKTLWPDSYDVTKIGDVTKGIVESNPSVRNSLITAEVDGIKINVRVDASGKVLTSYPTWKQ